MEQMQSEVQMYSPIMPSFRQVVQNADAGEFAWSLHGRVDDANQYSKTSRYLLDKMETLGTYPEDTTESISGYLGENYYLKVNISFLTMIYTISYPLCMQIHLAGIQKASGYFMEGLQLYFSL